MHGAGATDGGDAQAGVHGPDFPSPDRPSRDEGEGGWNRRSIYLLLMLTLIYALNYFDRSIISILLPQIQRDIRLSDTAMGLVAGAAFVIFYSAMGIPVARLADRGNRRTIIGIGVIFWSGMTALTGFAGNLWQLATTRFLMGAGEACGPAPSISMLSDRFDAQRRPLAIAILASGTAIGGILFTPAIGWIS